MFGHTCKIARALLVARAVGTSGQHSKRFYPAKKRRFYKEVSIVRSGDQFEVCLDQRKIKTPLGKLLLVPNEALAIAVATEWDCQQKEINPNEMHLTGLCNTVLDNPSKKTKEDMASDILEFLESDTLCYRMDEPDDLVILQKEKWDPLLRWYEERHSVRLGKPQVSGPIPSGLGASLECGASCHAGKAGERVSDESLGQRRMGARPRPRASSQPSGSGRPLCAAHLGVFERHLQV